MGQAGENALDTSSDQSIRLERFAAERRLARQTRMVLCHRLNLFLAASHSDYLGLRMVQQNLHQFQGGVARHAENGDFDHEVLTELHAGAATTYLETIPAAQIIAPV